jgi:hypothetical protein
MHLRDRPQPRDISLPTMSIVQTSCQPLLYSVIYLGTSYH